MILALGLNLIGEIGFFVEYFLGENYGFVSIMHNETRFIQCIPKRVFYDWPCFPCELSFHFLHLSERMSKLSFYFSFFFMAAERSLTRGSHKKSVEMHWVRYVFARS